MTLNSFPLLLTAFTFLSLVCAIVFHRDAVEAERRLNHARRLLDIRTQQRDDARAERDRAIDHAADTQEILNLASMDMRTRHPALAEREELDPRIARHLYVAGSDS